MKHLTHALLIIACSVLLGGCGAHRHSKSLPEVSERLTEQFRSQYDSVKRVLPARRLKSVQVTGFSSPSGNPRPYLGIRVLWEGPDSSTETGVPLIQLGDGLFGITYTDPDTKEELSAVLSFR